MGLFFSICKILDKTLKLTRGDINKNGIYN